MTARTFENEITRAVEDATLAIFKRMWKIRFHDRMPQAFSPADFRIIKGDGEWALLEVKSQDRAFLSGYTVNTATKKLIALHGLAVKHGVRAYVAFPLLVDRSVWWCPIDDLDLTGLETYMGGRHPRPGSANDQEQMVKIPVRLLRQAPETIDGGVADAALAYLRANNNGS